MNSAASVTTLERTFASGKNASPLADKVWSNRAFDVLGDSGTEPGAPIQILRIPAHIGSSRWFTVNGTIL